MSQTNEHSTSPQRTAIRDFTIDEIIRITGGYLAYGPDNTEQRVSGICTDSRKAKDGSLFIPFHGKTYDGHDFVGDALSQGCIASLVESLPDVAIKGKYYIRVPNAVEALWKLTEKRREMLRKCEIICVTGSVGKTTTASMISSVLKQRFNVFEPDENCNDAFTIPEMIFNINESHDVAVLELGLGMNTSVKEMAKHLGIRLLVLTNIGFAHIEKTGSLSSTEDEKCGAEEGLMPFGVVLYNGDDEILAKHRFIHASYSFGLGANNDIRPTEELTIPADHLTHAALAAAAVGELMGFSITEINDGISHHKPPKGRMGVTEYKHFTLIDSSYNASPTSVKLAIDVLEKMDGRKIAVIGDMYELGDFAELLHRDIGEYIAKADIDSVIAVGAYASCIANIPPYVHCAQKLPTNRIQTVTVSPYINCAEEELRREIECAAAKGIHSCVLIKGSHGTELYKLAERMKEWGELDGE